MKQITIDNTVINNLYQFLKTTDADLPSRTHTIMYGLPSVLYHIGITSRLMALGPTGVISN